MIMKYIFIVTICILTCVACAPAKPQKESPSPVPEATSETPAREELPQQTEEADPVEEPAPVLLAQAETKLLNRENDRVHNILLAAQEIDGYRLAPGEVFSFNRVVGERTTEKGYREAPVLIAGEEEQDCGGGVCQVSTTLYQAAEAAGLSVIERNNHQKEVGYAPRGSDAAVNYGTLDMRFENSTESV
ncbi:MAG: hypothetical protein E7414_04520, partial [Ruminococcaceae bacterium]|nr:hypothetical protein [Oscillospiraceae bacterium]